MKSSKFILPAIAFAIAIVGAFTSRVNSHPLQPTFYGMTGGSCTIGTVLEPCNLQGSIRCVVYTGSAFVPAFTGILIPHNPDLCFQEAFRSFD